MDDKYDVIDTEKLEQYLEEKRISLKCALCGQENMSVDEENAYAIMCITKEYAIATSNGRGSPYIAIVCPHCGHTVFINAVAMGLLKPLKPDEKEAKTDAQ